MGKHAYLIIANKNINQLCYLNSLLDNVKNDIYIMIDKKTELSSQDKNQIVNSARLSNVELVPRINIYWGVHTSIS